MASPLFCLLREKASCDEFRRMDAAAIKACLGEKAIIYHPYALLRTLERWESLACLSLPSEIRELMAATYAESSLPPGWEDLYAEGYGSELAEKRLADINTNIWQVALDDAADLKTRLSTDDALLVLCLARDRERITLLEGEEITLPADGCALPAVAKKLHRNTVHIPLSCLTGRPRDGMLAPYHIDGCCLLAREGPMTVPHLRPARKLYWDDALGVVIRKEER